MPTTVELQGLLTRQVVTSVDIVAKCLDQIEKHNHAGLGLNAVISVAPRIDVLKYAKQLDDERAKGKLRGPFHGIPILVKDAYNTPGVGLPTTCGSFALAQAKAKSNAKVVDKVLSAGMIIIAKANMSELGNMKGFDLMAGWSAVGGQTQNPYIKGGIRSNSTWLSHWGPAGSSSGSAAGVAAGFAPLSLGTESNGSIIMPACRAGLFALKITLDTVDTTGVQPAIAEFDCLGGFSRSATDIARLTAIMQGHDSETYLPLSQSWAGLRLGFVDPTLWRSYPSALETIDGFWEEMDESMFAAQERIEKLGGKVVKSIPLIAYDDITAAMPDMENMEDLYLYGIRQSFSKWLPTLEGAPRTIEELVDFHKAHADQEFTERNDNQKLLEAVIHDNTTTEKYNANLRALRQKASSSVLELLHANEVDVVIGPSDSRTGSVGSAAGFPVANLPLGFAQFNGRPYGLHMIGPAGTDAKMLQIMGAWEATFPEAVQPPPLLVEFK